MDTARTTATAHRLNAHTSGRDCQRTFGWITNGMESLLIGIKIQFSVVTQSGAREQQGERCVLRDLLPKYGNIVRYIRLG